jgi:hypothetical protein
MLLLSVQTHCRWGSVCCFITNMEDDCWLTFPNLCIEIDDNVDCLLPLSYVTADSQIKYSQPCAGKSQSRTYLASTVHACWMTIAQQQTTMAHSTFSPPDPTLQDTYIIPLLPPNVISESFAPTKIRKWSGSKLHSMFGSRHLPNFKVLKHLRTGLQLTNPCHPPTTISNMVNINSSLANSSLAPRLNFILTVGIDIGYGNGKSPGGFTHILVLIDPSTQYGWTYMV